MKRHFHWDRKYLYWGITAFCVIAAAVLFYMTLRFLPELRKALSGLVRILSPFLWGFVITYLIAPLMKLLNRKVFGPLCRKLYAKNKKSDGSKLARGLAVLVTELVMIAVITGIVALILPKLIENITTLINERQTYYDAVTRLIQEFQIAHPQVYEAVGQQINNITGGINSWIEQMLPNVTNYLGSFMQSAYVVLRGVYNLIIGIIVSVYVLSDLENFTAGFRRWIYSAFSLETAERVREAIAFTDRTFMGFISGKLLDSAIIGLICYIGCSILRIPEALLVSAIVGITNIIPFFGPFIGAVPCAFFILMIDPVKCLVFIIFVIVLQQIDGNIIGPKILGNSIGITGFWVLFAIVIGAGLFGFGGMLLGVPVFVVIYTFINGRIQSRLRNSDLPEETAAYQNLDHIDPVTRQPVEKEENGKSEKSE